MHLCNHAWQKEWEAGGLTHLCQKVVRHQAQRLAPHILQQHMLTTRQNTFSWKTQ